MKGEYLNNIVNLDEIIPGQMNLIFSPCGSGKTTLAKEKLINLKHENTMLYLIDTANGKEQLLQGEGAVSEYNEYTDQLKWTLPGINVMTYAGYAVLNEKAPERDIWQKNALIICDELQNPIKWSKWTKDSQYHSKALGLLYDRLHNGSNTIVTISATPKAIIEECIKWGALEEISLHGEPRRYESFKVQEYRTLQLLLNELQPNKRGIIYLPLIQDIKKYQTILEERGFSTAAIWSINNDENPMNDDQLDIREYILSEREIPEDIDILFINRACETSITIGSENNTKNPIDFMIIHSTDPDTQTQVRGRYRNDLDELYLLNPLADDIITLPDEWLNRPLSASDKQELCRTLQIPSQRSGRIAMWSTIKPKLEKSGYLITHHRTSIERYDIISKAI